MRGEGSVVRRDGGMVDAEVSKTSEGNLLRVRVPLPVCGVNQRLVGPAAALRGRAHMASK